jgi:hypothetical protein
MCLHLRFLKKIKKLNLKIYEMGRREAGGSQHQRIDPPLEMATGSNPSGFANPNPCP